MRNVSIRPIAGLRGLGIALLLAVAPWSAAQAAAPDGLIVDLFFDLADEAFAEPSALAADLMPADGVLQIAGIPLRLGTGHADAGWRTVAGANGSYVLPTGGPIGVVAKARVARTDFYDAEAPGKSSAAAATDFTYALDGWTLGLEPGLEIARWDSERTRWDARVDGRFSRPIIDRLSLAGRAQYRWYQVRGIDPADGEVVSGRLGLICELLGPVRLNLAYAVQHEAVTTLGNAGPNTVGSAGPSVAVTLPLGEDIGFSATYDLTTTHRSGAETESVTQRLHRLVAAVTWDIGLDMAALSARYSFENAAHASAYHAGMVNFGLSF